MPTARTSGRGATRLLASGCALPIVAGCLGDPPPDPATALLEVVLDGCVLNRHEVAPGPHEVALVGSGRLLVTDESGEQVAALPGGSAELTPDVHLHLHRRQRAEHHDTAVGPRQVR